MSTRVEITGMEELQHKLEKLQDKLQREYTDKALLAGAEPILQEQKATCPVSPVAPHAKDFLEISPPRSEDGNRMVEVGVQKDDMSMAFYLKFSEWGWTVPFERVMCKKSGHAYIRKIKNGGHKIAPKPFLEPAFNSKKEEAIEKIIEVLREELEND